MQITVTDHNDWEGEDFSFVLEVDEELAEKIRAKSNHENMEVEVGTAATKDDIKKINNRSKNGYMDRIGFYKFKNIDAVKWNDLYHDVFYKGVGLVKVE